MKKGVPRGKAVRLFALFCSLISVFVIERNPQIGPDKLYC